MTVDDFTLTHPVPVGGRASHDFYPTPRWCTAALIDHWQRDRDDLWWNRAPQSVLDPACGEGAILDLFAARKMETLGLELDPARAEVAHQRGHKTGTGDALARAWPRADCCVMNPPYTLAEAFVRKALEWRNGVPGWPPFFALLRLSFLEPTETRRTLLGAYTPDVWILPRRPAYDGRGTDSVTSAWFRWPGEGRLVWLPEGK